MLLIRLDNITLSVPPCSSSRAKMVLFAVESVCGCVCGCVRVTTVEPFELL